MQLWSACWLAAEGITNELMFQLEGNFFWDSVLLSYSCRTCHCKYFLLAYYCLVCCIWSFFPVPLGSRTTFGAWCRNCLRNTCWGSITCEEVYRWRPSSYVFGSTGFLRKCCAEEFCYNILFSRCLSISLFFRCW